MHPHIFHDEYLGKRSLSLRLLVLCTTWTYYRTVIASIYKLAWITVEIRQPNRVILNCRLAYPEVLPQPSCVRGAVLQQQLAHLFYRVYMHAQVEKCL